MQVLLLDDVTCRIIEIDSLDEYEQDDEETLKGWGQLDGVRKTYRHISGAHRIAVAG